MPVYSMTGYASLQSTPSTASADHSETPPSPWRLSLEVRSVNSRFLDLHFRLPDELRPYENTLREQLQKQLRRGKVELRASLERTGSLPDQLQVPGVLLLQKLASAQDTIRTWLPDAAPLSVADVLRLSPPSQPALLPEAELRPWIQQAADQLLNQLREARETEGRQLADSLLQRVQQLRALSAEAEPLIPQVVEAQRQRFLDKWKDALQAGSSSGNVSRDAAQDRALAEAAAFSLRIDVAEELTRLQSHLDTIEDLLKKGGELGKRLDFLIQELHRAANTLGSKSASSDTSRIAMDMKVLVEQMREQVQNIE